MGKICSQEFPTRGKTEKMPETRFTEFQALSVDPRVEISRPASETDVRFFLLSMTFKIFKYHSSFLYL